VACALAVIVTSVALGQAESVVWASDLPLFPLGLLWLTGMSCSCCCMSRSGTSGDVAAERAAGSSDSTAAPWMNCGR